MKILLVDDESTFLEQAKTLLKKENKRLDIDTALSAEEGLELIDKNDYDAIVSDYQMPQIDGLELLKIIRAEKNSEIPFIIFTGKGREEVAMNALNLGADLYLQKGGSPRTQYGVLAQSIVREVEHREDREKMKSLAKYPSQNPNPVLRIGKDGKILYSNKEGKALLSEWGVGIDEVIPKRWQKLIGEIFETEKAVNKEFEVEEKVYSITINPIPDEGYANLYACDITELKKTQERKSFLNTLLRQDLASKYQIIHGYIQLLDENENLSEEQEKYLRKAGKACQEADEIIGMAKKLKEIGENEGIFENDIPTVLDKAIKNVLNSADRKDIEIEKNYPKEIGTVSGDYSLQNLFFYLLRIRAQNPKCDRIRIDAEEKNEKILLRIEDNGDRLIDDVKRLFSGEIYTGKTSGAGGVRYYMLKEIAKHNDAKLKVQDSDLGGARFDIHLEKI